MKIKVGKPVPRIEQSGGRSLRRPKLPIKGGSVPEEEEEEEEEEEKEFVSSIVFRTNRA